MASVGEDVHYDARGVMMGMVVTSLLLGLFCLVKCVRLTIRCDNTLENGKRVVCVIVESNYL